MTTPDLNTALETAAAAPAVYQNDGERVEQHNLKDLQTAADRQASNTAIAGKRRGLLLSKVTFPGMR